MDILVAYDVDTTAAEGEARLRKVATICKNVGQRVQKSVFECRVSQARLEELEARLLKVIDMKKDSLRIYVLHGGRERSVRVHGVDRYVDFEGLLVT